MDTSQEVNIPLTLTQISASGAPSVFVCSAACLSVFLSSKKTLFSLAIYRVQRARPNETRTLHSVFLEPSFVR